MPGMPCYLAPAVLLRAFLSTKSSNRQSDLRQSLIGSANQVVKIAAVVVIEFCQAVMSNDFNSSSVKSCL